MEPTKSATWPRFPPSIGTIHFVGIGGCGMSGLASILHQLGYTVQGSDSQEEIYFRKLKQQGVHLFTKHDARNVLNAQLVVTSSATTANIEVATARERHIPVIHRSEMLAELMHGKKTVGVAGTHGKTTTTSMVDSVLATAALDPTVINGGVIHEHNSNVRLGQGDWMVVESDESDGSFLRLPTLIAVVTSIDGGHLSHWGTREAEEEAFAKFVNGVPFYGVGVLCVDDPGVRAMMPRLHDRRLVTYGVSEAADVRAEDIIYETDRCVFNVSCRTQSRPDSNSDTDSYVSLGQFTLNALGLHNIRNALAAITVALELNISTHSMQSALQTFQGVFRRFNHLGAPHGIHVVDDYAHHPAQVTAGIQMAKQAGARNVIAIFESSPVRIIAPLREEYGRCFEGASTAIVLALDCVTPEMGAQTREFIVEAATSYGGGGGCVVGLADHRDLPALVAEIAGPEDYVLCMGWRSMTHWARELVAQLESMDQAVLERTRSSLV